MTTKEFVFKVVLGLLAVGGGLYVLYQFLIAPLKAKQDELNFWQEEWIKQYNKYIEDGVLTDEEKYGLEAKRTQIERVSKEILSFGWTPEKIFTFLVEAGLAIIGLYVGKKAIDFLFARKTAGEIKGTYSYIYACGSAINGDLYDKGFISEAVAAQTSLDDWVNTVYIPQMQSAITYYNSVIPYLSGMELLWAQYMVATLQAEIFVYIPSIMAQWPIWFPPPI